AMKRPCNREHFATISGAGVQPGGIWAGLSRRDPEGERGLAGIRRLVRLLILTVLFMKRTQAG
ncbi:MAG: hypothetical protein WCB46_11275, partial [Methanoregula sp.]